MGYRFGRAAPNADERYVKEIRPNAELNADASYFISPYFALGLKYAYTSSAGSAYSGTSILSNISTHYIGPILYTKAPLNSYRSKLFCGISVGCIDYKDDGWIDHKKTMLKSSTFGTAIEIAYDFRLYRGLFIGLNTGLNGGVISKMYLNGGRLNLGDNKEGLTRLYGAIGLRYMKD